MAPPTSHETEFVAPLDLRLARMFADIDTMQKVLLPTKVDQAEDASQRSGRQSKSHPPKKTAGRRHADNDDPKADRIESGLLTSWAGSADAAVDDDTPRTPATRLIKLREYEMLEGIEDGRVALRHRERIQDLSLVAKEKVQHMLESQVDEYYISSRSVIRDEVVEMERRIEQLGLPDPSKICRRTQNLEVELDWYTSQAVRLHLLSRDYLKETGEWRDRVDDLKTHIADLKVAMRTSSRKNRLLKSTMEDISSLPAEDLHPVPLDFCTSSGTAKSSLHTWNCRPTSSPASARIWNRPDTTSSGCRQRTSSMRGPSSSTRAPSTRSSHTPSAPLRKPHTAPSIMALPAARMASAQSARSARHLRPLAGTMPDMCDLDDLTCCIRENPTGSPLEATLLPSSRIKQQGLVQSSVGNSRIAGAGVLCAEDLRPHTAPCDAGRAPRNDCGSIAPGQEYLDEIARLTSQLKRRRKDREEKQAKFGKAFSRTCNLEEFFLSCLADLRKDMIRKGVQGSMPARAKSSNSAGMSQKEAVLAILMSSEDLLVFLYEKLFPHRSGVLSGERVESPRPALKLPDTVLQDIDAAMAALSSDVLFGAPHSLSTGSIRTPRVNCA